MPIKYQVISRGEPGVVGGGAKKFYASAITSGEINIDELTTAIEKISTVSGADIRAVLYALVDVSTDELGKSFIVRLGDLGSLRASLSSSGHDKEEDVNSTAIKGARIVFTPGSRLKKMLKAASFQKA